MEKINNLTDLEKIKIDTSKSIEERIEQFSSQTPNFFVNKIEDYIVKVSYKTTFLTLNEKIKSYIKRVIEEKE